ncbi:hypothetical protein DFH29DRAFT_914180 [Suillus ampliporus]|nr:hypothetical protein DFH29DRAFT_967974 [Suillus ampliporus]KAG0704022.1 hypothetical protein DFH29DRAFT_914180 [Suillus ampliporus]
MLQVGNMAIFRGLDPWAWRMLWLATTCLFLSSPEYRCDCDRIVDMAIGSPLCKGTFLKTPKSPRAVKANYRVVEPCEGGMSVGAARERVIRAGLCYSAGGFAEQKYWLPGTVMGLDVESDHRELVLSSLGNDGEVAAPLLAEDVEDVGPPACRRVNITCISHSTRRLL